MLLNIAVPNLYVDAVDFTQRVLGLHKQITRSHSMYEFILILKHYFVLFCAYKVRPTSP